MIRSMQAAIFDLDGVLVDTAKYHYRAWRRLARQLGFEFTEAENERLKGVSRMRSLEILLEVGGIRMDEAGPPGKSRAQGRLVCRIHPEDGSVRAPAGRGGIRSQHPRPGNPDGDRIRQPERAADHRAGANRLPVRCGGRRHAGSARPSPNRMSS